VQRDGQGAGPPARDRRAGDACQGRVKAPQLELWRGAKGCLRAEKILLGGCVASF
jgi:hypothetical protein